jgi:hypothetical protein
MKAVSTSETPVNFYQTLQEDKPSSGLQNCLLLLREMEVG